MAMELTAKDRIVLKRLFGWHAVPWMDAFSRVLRHLDACPETVLEIGASGHSVPSMFFLQKGACVEVTCYMEQELSALRRFCECFCLEHQLPLPLIRTRDVFATGSDTYDMVLMKGVLGGLDRKHDAKVFAHAVEACLRMLRPGGQVIIMDKGWCTSLHNRVLRRFGVAGRNNWHYFSQDELDSMTGQAERPAVIWKGFLSLGVMPYPWMQGVVDGLDRSIFNQLLYRRGTVFAAAYGKKPSYAGMEKMRMELRAPSARGDVLGG